MKTAYPSVHPNMNVVDEQDTVYLIPLGAPPVRLNGTASDIWRFLTAAKSIEEVVGNYESEYACSTEEARGDVLAFVNEMVEKGYLVQ